MTLLGVAIALGETALAEKQSGLEWLGILAVFASALTGAVCSVLYGPYVERYPTLQVSFIAMLAAVDFLILLAFPEGFYQGLPRIDGTGWAAVLFIGLASAVGYYLWLWALAHTTATRVTVFLALSPLTAALLGAWFLGEALTLSLLAALFYVAGGLWLAHRD